jgi:hypothetical protein
VISINALLSLGISRKKIIFTSDVPGAYLHADIDEIIIMRLPKSCTFIWLLIVGIPQEEWYLWIRNGYIYVRILKALYGLIQSSLLCFHNITSTLEEMGFKSCINDPCIFSRERNGCMYYIGLYVDDLIHVCDNVQERDDVSNELTRRYGSMDHHYGNQLSFLSLSINIDYEKGILTMDQDAYLAKFMETNEISRALPSQSYATNNDFEYLLEEDESDMLSKVESTSYKSLLMTLMFVATRTRPDILFVVGVLATKMSNPRRNSLSALHHLIGYIKNHPNMKITYIAHLESSPEWNRIELYVDASWHLHEDGKGHSGCIIKLFGNTISFKSLKQSKKNRSLINYCYE